MKFYISTTDSEGIEQYRDKLQDYDITRNPEAATFETKWIINLDDLNDLVELSKTLLQEIIVTTSDYLPSDISGYLEIYDYYRE